MDSDVHEIGRRAYVSARARLTGRAHLLDLLADREAAIDSLAKQRADLREQLDELGVLLVDLAGEPGIPTHLRELCGRAAAKALD